MTVDDLRVCLERCAEHDEIQLLVEVVGYVVGAWKKSAV